MLTPSRKLIFGGNKNEDGAREKMPYEPEKKIPIRSRNNNPII